MQATEKFQLSQRFFDEKRYADALIILDQLAAEFPGEKNVLYPRALCLYKLGRYDEAGSVSRVLVDRYADVRAFDLLERIKAKEALPPAGVNVPDLVLSVEPAHSPTPSVRGMEKAPAARTTLSVFLICAVSLVAGAGILGYVWFGLRGPSQTGDVPSPPSAAAETAEPAGALAPVETFAPEETSAPVEAPAPAEAAASQTAQGATPLEELRITWIDIKAYLAGNYNPLPFSPTVFFFCSGDSAECGKMEKDVFENSSVIWLTEGWRFVRIDVTKNDVNKVCQDLHMIEVVNSTPTVVVRDSAGKEVYRQEGVISARNFYAALAALELHVEPLEHATADARFRRLVLFLPLSVVVSLFCLFTVVLYAFQLDSAARVRYLFVCVALMLHLWIAGRGFLADFALPFVSATDAVVHVLGNLLLLLALLVSVIILGLDAFLGRQWTYSAFRICVWIMLPLWWFRLPDTHRFMDLRALAGWSPIILLWLATIFIVLPLARSAHELNDRGT